MAPIGWLIVALLLNRMQLMIGASNYGNKHNGIGSVEDVLARQAAAPMCYRVLVPLMLAVIPKSRWIEAYACIQVGLIACALWTVEQALGMPRTMLVVVMLPATFLYDYWDWSVELGAIAAALTGNLYLAVAWGIAYALSRETSLLVAVVYRWVSNDLNGALALFAIVYALIVAVHLWQGSKPLYCERVMVRQNWMDLMQFVGLRPFFESDMAMTLVISALTLAAAVVQVPYAFFGLVFLDAGWIFGIAQETRLFSVCLLWVVQLVG